MNHYKSVLNSSWKSILTEEFNKTYFKDLMSFVDSERETQQVFPSEDHTYKAFNLTPFDKIKVIIIGQDPYHGDGQAHGLAFSVPEGIAHPPSLRNIFKELKNDLDIEKPQSGNLDTWASEGVLLINATLTVRAHEAGSHQKKGWEIFTDAVIKKIAEEKENIVFILWGNYAQKKGKFIDSSKHHIIKSTHPSPLSANRGGFFESKPFSKTNVYLESKKIKPINWNL